MSQRHITPLPDGELRVYEPDPKYDLGRMYVIDVLGVTLLVRQRDDGMYVNVDTDAISDLPTDATKQPLIVDVLNAGEHTYDLA